MILRKANIYDTNDIAKVHSEVWEDFYGKYVTPKYLQKLSYENRRKFWLKYINEGKIVYVMEEKTGGIVGFCVPKMVKINASQAYGEVVAHYVAEPAMHKGYGTALLVACAKLFQKNEADYMSLWVHRDNPSTVFYRKMGGVEKGANVFRLDNKDIVKLNYVWEDLVEFIESHQYALENIVNEY